MQNVFLACAVVALVSNGVIAGELTLGGTPTDVSVDRNRRPSSDEPPISARVESLEAEVEALQALLDSVPNADFEPPTVVIDAPQYATGADPAITATFEDNRGLFKVKVESVSPSSTETRWLYAEEQSMVLELSTSPLFGGDTVLHAYATDLAGNTTTATSIIYSESAIVGGLYILDTPLDEQISGSGCGLRDHGPITITSNELSVRGYFRNEWDVCDWQDSNEDPDAVACVSVSIPLGSDYFFGAYVNAAIASTADSSFSKDQLNLSSGGGAEDYEQYAYMDVQFFDTAPPSVSVDLMLRCESSLYGTEEFGPYHLDGTLQQ